MIIEYKGRALPLAWRVRQAPKGHFPEDLHIAVVELMCEVIPEGAKVVFLGDGEFDGTALQDTLNKMGWSYGKRSQGVERGTMFNRARRDQVDVRRTNW